MRKSKQCSLQENAENIMLDAFVNNVNEVFLKEQL